MQNTNLTDSEKLKQIRAIVDKNLFPIFTAFALNMEADSHTTLEEYVKLKELLNIDRGVERNQAINYDNFKKNNFKNYQQMMNKLDNRILQMKKEKPNWFGYSNLSTYMFMSAVYPIHIGSGGVSENMTFKEFNDLLEGIDSYEFISG